MKFGPAKMADVELGNPVGSRESRLRSGEPGYAAFTADD